MSKAIKNMTKIELVEKIEHLKKEHTDLVEEMDNTITDLKEEVDNANIPTELESHLTLINGALSGKVKCGQCEKWVKKEKLLKHCVKNHKSAFAIRFWG